MEINYFVRHVYNSSIDILDVNKAYKAPFSLWKQWLLDSNTCKPMVPGRTFADVVKQNAYSSNSSGKKSVPLEAIQMFKPKGMSPESVKEENLHCTSSSQVRTTRVNRNTQNVNRATDTVDNVIPLVIRFAILQSEDDQEMLIDPDFESEFTDKDIQFIFPCSGKASPLPGDQNVTWDVFDKILFKKKVDQNHH